MNSFHHSIYVTVYYDYCNSIGKFRKCWNRFRAHFLVSQFLSRQSRVVSVGFEYCAMHLSMNCLRRRGTYNVLQYGRSLDAPPNPRVLYIAKCAQPTSVYLRWFFSKVIEICVGQSCICRLIAWQPYTLTVLYMSLANTYDVAHFMKSILHLSRICLVVLYAEI